MKKIFFRADAGQNIGFGHFIRTLALADMLKDKFDCTFVTQTPNEYQKAEVAKICKLVELPDDNSKFNLFLEMLTSNEIVVLDNYFYTTDYQKSIKAKGCKLVCIDDMHDKHYVADVVINHGLDNPQLFDMEPYTRLCLGLQWALLRKPFLEAAKTRRHLSDKINRIVICFGGVDKYNLTDKAIKKIITQKNNIQIDAIVGNFYQSTLSDTDKQRVQFYRNIPAEQVANLFLSDDLAIVSASTICLEAMACGIRVAAGWYVDNQKEGYENLVKNNYVYALGNLLENTDSDIDMNLFKQVCFGEVAQRYNNLFLTIC